MLKAIRGWLRNTPEVNTRPAFGDFLTEQAFFASQKSVVSYCEVKAGVNRDKLFAEQEFQEALTRCRWESFAAVLADLTLLSYRFLRDHAAGREADLAAALVRLYAALLDAQARPSHRPEGWEDVVLPLAARLEQARVEGVASPSEVARTAARRVMQVLPIHEEHRRQDREAIEGAVRFHTVAVWEAMGRRVDAPAVAAALLKT